MTAMTITVNGNVITDVTEHRAELRAVRSQLATIYIGFDPKRPERLLLRQKEIVALLNRAEVLREIVETWDEQESARANILAGWELVRSLDEGKA